VYRLEAVAHRYVSKGNTATDRIYRGFRARKMAFWLQSILQVGSSSDLTTTPLGIDTEATNNPQ